jgi:tetratricopeptide (TPR) repeat protein
MNRVLVVVITSFYSLFAMAGKLELNSSPDKAEIWVKKDPNDSGTKIGETPFTGTTEELFAQVDDGKTAVIELKREGFTPYRFLAIGSTKDSDLTLRVTLEVTPEVKAVKEHDSLMAELFKVQKMIRSKNYGDALMRLESLEKDHRHFSIIPELKGITHYMNKDMEKALSMFRLAFSLNPDNADAYKMKVFLEKKLGIDAE